VLFIWESTPMAKLFKIKINDPDGIQFTIIDPVPIQGWPSYISIEPIRLKLLKWLGNISEFVFLKESLLNFIILYFSKIRDTERYDRNEVYVKTFPMLKKVLIAALLIERICAPNAGVDNLDLSYIYLAEELRLTEEYWSEICQHHCIIQNSPATADFISLKTNHPFIEILINRLNIISPEEYMGTINTTLREALLINGLEFSITRADIMAFIDKVYVPGHTMDDKFYYKLFGEMRCLYDIATIMESLYGCLKFDDLPPSYKRFHGELQRIEKRYLMIKDTYWTVQQEGWKKNSNILIYYS